MRILYVILIFLSCTISLLRAADPYELKKTVKRYVEPVEISERIKNRSLVDFGANAFGYLEIIPPKGTRGKYDVRLGELIKKDGSVNLKPGATIRAARIRGEITKDGIHRVPLVPDKRNTSNAREGVSIKIPDCHGVIMPFRYAEFKEAPFKVTSKTVRMVAINYPINMDESSFVCDDERLNKIYNLCKHTILVSSFAGLYVDGDRERIPYEADAYINQLSDYAVHSDYSMARATHEYFFDHPTWPTEWKQHSIFMAWADWMWSGDIRSIEKYYDRLSKEKLMEHCRREEDGLLETGGERPKNGLVNSYGAADIVDWPIGERDGFVFKTVNSVINAFYYRNLIQLSEMALALKKTADSRKYKARAEKLYKKYNELFFDEKRGVYRDGIGTNHASLHANAAALAFGLVPEKNKEKVAKYCISRGMACSVYFSQYLLEALFNAGKDDKAIELIVSSGERSWLGMIEQGATTTMEAWAVKFKPNLDLCHAWGTAPINIISRYILGVTPLEPGFEKVSIRPQLGHLKMVSGVVPTKKGRIEVKVEKGVLSLTTPVPAHVVFDSKTYDVPAGRHVFSE